MGIGTHQGSLGVGQARSRLARAGAVSGGFIGRLHRASSIGVDARVTSLDARGIPEAGATEQRDPGRPARSARAPLRYRKRQSCSKRPRRLSSSRRPLRHSAPPRRKASPASKCGAFPIHATRQPDDGRAGPHGGLPLSPGCGCVLPLLLVPQSNSAAAHGRAQHRAVADRLYERRSAVKLRLVLLPCRFPVCLWWGWVRAEGVARRAWMAGGIRHGMGAALISL